MYGIGIAVFIYLPDLHFQLNFKLREKKFNSFNVFRLFELVPTVSQLV